MNNKKKTFWLILTGIALAVVVSIGIGYAFYAAQVGSGAKTNVNVTSDSSDKLTFTKGSDISLKATQFNFTNGGTNLSSETTSSATLKANSTNNTANSTYNVYFIVSNNTYTYTNGTTPEIILTITDPTGAAVTSIAGLTYVTSGDTSGFDITTYKGIINVATDYAISATSSTTGTTQNWKTKVTYINLPTDQTANAGSSMSANLLVQKNKVTKLYEKVLLSNGGTDSIAAKGTPNFANVATTDEGMYAAPDDYGTSYYFRGAVSNNWVKFAGIYWRIVRINGNNTVKLVYSGTAAPTESQKVVMTGTGTQINGTAYAFNPTYNDNMYVGYKYESGNVHGLTTNSTAKTTIDSWYSSNLASQASKIADVVYCNDRSLSSGTGTGTTTTYYGAYARLVNSKAPILTCPNKSDAFTVADTTHGNASLQYPVALLTADEIAMAGGVWYTNNSSFYLYTNQLYWSLSPSFFNSGFAFEFVLSSGGVLDSYGCVAIPAAFVPQFP
jgi:hypothetical protein